MRAGRLLFAAALLAAALPAVGAGAVGAAAAPGSAASCAAPSALAGIGASLRRAAAHVKPGATLTIVAFGSSSTSGFGASAPRFSYPSRLEADLRRLLPETRVRVVNRGKGGEEVSQMLKRLDRDVLALHPDLVIWQLGTNTVLHRHDPAAEEPLIARGLARLKEQGIDVVLMDMQYAPRVIAQPASRPMEQIIAAAAKRAHVGLFRRFQIMRAWLEQRPADPPQMVGRDGVHMNDRGYGCIAADLAEALAAAWRSPPPEAAAGRVRIPLAALAAP
jgi:lysophospholipase L1-like esterase